MSGAAGGAAMSTIALMRALRERGIASSAVCHPLGTREEIERLQDACEGELVTAPLLWWNKKIRASRWKRPLIAARDLTRTGLAARSTLEVVRAARRFKTTLIHTNTLVTLEGALASRAIGLPHVWHIREMVGPGQPFRFPWERATLGRLLRWGADLVVANSAPTAARLPLPQHEPLLRIVPNGIDIQRFVIRETRRDGPLVIGMVGNLTTHWKKHPIALEAMALVARELPQALLHLYGHDRREDGRPDLYIEQLRARAARPDLIGRVTFAGFVEDPADIMSSIDVLLHPADGESFGRVLVEAMAAQVPVVSVRGGGAASVVLDGSTGYLTAVDDHEAMARAVIDLGQSPSSRESFGRAGRARASAYFSLEAHADAIATVYEDARVRFATRSRSAPRQPRP